LTFATDTWTLHTALRLTMENICPKLYQNTSIHVEVTLRTRVLRWPKVRHWPLSGGPGFCVQHTTSSWWTFVLNNFINLQRMTFDLLWPWPSFCASTCRTFVLSFILLSLTQNTWIFCLTLCFTMDNISLSILKSLHACGSYALDTGLAVSPKCDLDLWMVDLGFVCD
jgi:hypothetical protein